MLPDVPESRYFEEGTSKSHTERTICAVHARSFVTARQNCKILDFGNFYVLPVEISAGNTFLTILLKKVFSNVLEEILPSVGKMLPSEISEVPKIYFFKKFGKFQSDEQR